MAVKIFIAGIPAMGKTKIGDTLKKDYGYRHIDLETTEINNFALNPYNYINELAESGTDVVVTWGFVPDDTSISLVKYFESKGFNVIWFDGNQEAARREFIRRETENNPERLQQAIAALDLQMNKIESSQVVSKIDPIIINTFDKESKFRSVEKIIDEILSKSSTGAL